MRVSLDQMRQNVADELYILTLFEASAVRSETVPIQLAQCRLTALAISSAKA